MQIIPANDEFFESAQGADFTPHEGEGIIYVKFVMIRPATLKDGDPKDLIEKAQAVILCGRFEDMKEKIATFFDEAAKQY